MTFRMPFQISALLMAASAAASLGAQPAALVADLATSGATPSGSNPLQLTAVRNGRIVFAAEEPGSGRELWASDGTAAGTLLLADLCPGPCGSDPASLGTWDGAALFTVATEQGQDQIWRSDGTRSGTAPLRDPGDSGDEGAPLQVFRPHEHPEFAGFLDSATLGGSLYFEACGKAQGCGLWRTDGTPAGTRLVAGRAALGGREIHSVATADHTVFFAVRRPDLVSAFLWCTDGTAAGTIRLATLRSLPRSPTPVGGKLFFTGSGGYGEELWVSDGTRAGTRPLTSFRPPLPFGGGGDGPPVLSAFPGHVDFAAHDGAHGWEIWQSDGTPDGTRRITDFARRAPFQNVFQLPLAEVGGRLLVPAFEPFHGTGWSLWASDGSSMIRLHTCLGGCENESSIPPRLVNQSVTQGDRVLFAAGAGYGQELWSTDGTRSGTRKLLNACTGACNSVLSLTPWSLQGREVFKIGAEDGEQLWTTDGTAAGTRRLFQLPSGVTLGALPVAAAGRLFFGAADGDGMELWVGENGQARQAANLASDATSSSPAALVAVGSHLVFQAGLPGRFPSDNSTRDLWQSEGTEAATSRLLAPFKPPEDCEFINDCFAPMAAADGWLAIVHTPGDDVSELWGTDGTAPGTRKLLTVAAPDRIQQLAAFQSTVIFFVGWQVWRSDGTPAGTVHLTDLAGGSVSSLGGTGTEVHFLLADASSFALWRSDGTAEGTGPVAVLPLGTAFLDAPPVRAGRQVWFEIYGQGSRELWATDGTEEGTVRVMAGLDFVSERTELGGALYFLARRGEVFGLWRSEGTAAGTALLHSWAELPTGLTAFAGRLFFAAAGSEGVELWSSDGTRSGTGLLRDIDPTGGSHPSAFAVLGDRLYFSAFDPEHGFELWQSDGTAGGTRLHQDIVPGPLSSAPDRLTRVGDRLYFTADDGVHGRELWSLR